MAKKLESDLAGTTCQMCTELYTDPLLLPCLHSYCKKCLVKFNEKQNITCPSCDQVSKIPGDGVKAFPQNLWLAHHVEEERCREKLSGKESMSCQRCVSGRESGKGAVSFCCECCKFLCSYCKNDHQKTYDTLNHKLVGVGEKKENFANAEITIPRKKQYCIQHDEELKFFCETCQEMMCRDCLLCADHKDHRYGYYDKVAEKGRSDLQTSLQGCDEVITVLDDDIGNCEKMVQHIQTRKKEVDRELDNVHHALSKALDDRFKVLKNTNAKIANDKIDSIHKQVNMFTKLKSQASRGRAFVNLALKTHKPSELLSVKKSIEGLLQQSKSSFEVLSHEPVEIDYVEASLKHSSLSDQIAKFGHVISLVDPALCSIVAGTAVPLATVGRTRNFSLVLKNSFGAVKRAVSLQVALKSSNGRKIPVTISTKGGPSKPTLTFTPDTTGEHELSIMVTGTHIQGSPYRMWVRQERNLANVGGTQTHFQVGNNIYGGVAVHHNGDVYCCNYGGHCVCVFDKMGTKTTIGSQGSGNGQFSYPRGLAIVGDILYVADTSNNRVQKFTLTGEYVGQFGSKGSGDGQFHGPTAIAHDGRGHVIVAEESNHRIQIFQLDGVHVRSIGCDGSNVYGVAVDNDGNIHVPLYSKNIVHVYSFEDEKPSSYSDKGGNFYNPCGIFIDDNGYRYITTIHSSHYYLHILDTEGERVKLISVHSPQAVTLDTEGYIYVAECTNQRVSKY